MGAAFERIGAQPELGERSGHHIDMNGLAEMRGAGHGDGFIVEVEPVHRSGPEQGQRLHRLDRRTRQHRMTGIADARAHVSKGIADRIGAAMDAFAPIAADGFNQNWIQEKTLDFRPLFAAKSRASQLGGHEKLEWVRGRPWNRDRSA